MAKTPAERARAKYGDYCRSIGKPLLVTLEEVAELKRHLLKLRAKGMSYAQISESAAGHHNETTISKIMNHPNRRIRRDVYNDLWQAHYIPPNGPKTGRKVDATGTQRRVRALAYDGFNYELIGGMLEISGQAVFQLATHNRPVHQSTADRIAVLYDKLAGADPMDYGSTLIGKTRATNAARRRGWSPSHCWDPDTIDDPYAAPEWTGACGTVQGWRIHYRDNVRAGSTHAWVTPLDVDWIANMASPVIARYVHRYIGGPSRLARQVFTERVNVTRSDTSCDACANARHIARQFPHLAELLDIVPPPCRPGSNDGEADWPGIAAAIDSGEYSLHAIAADFGVSTRTVQRVKREMSNGGDV